MPKFARLADETNGGGSGSGAGLWGWWAFPALVSGLATTRLLASLLGGTEDRCMLCEMKRGPYPGFNHQLLKPTTNKLKQIQVKVAKRLLSCPETFVGQSTNLSLYEIIIILSLQPMCAIVVVVGHIDTT